MATNSHSGCALYVSVYSKLSRYTAETYVSCSGSSVSGD